MLQEAQSIFHQMCRIHFDSYAPPSKNIVDTSIKHPISGQSITEVKGCMYIRLIW